MIVSVYFEQKKEKWKLIKLRFYIPVRTKYVISEMLFPAKFLASTEKNKNQKPEETRMWANAQRDGRHAKHRWCPLFNTAKFG